MAEDKKYIPELRFPEFEGSGEWGVDTVGHVIKSITPPKKLEASEYRTKGKYPIIDQSQKHIAGYSDDQDALINTEGKEMIVFGDHTCSLKFVDHPFIQGADGIKIFISNTDKISTRYLYQYLSAFPIESKEYKRHFSDLKKIKIAYPDNDILEQKTIEDCLFSIDKRIYAAKNKLHKLHEHKKGLMQLLFPNKMNIQPELRFPEFKNDSPWKAYTLGDLTFGVNKRNRSNRILPVYSINNIDGFIPQSEQFKGLDSEVRGYDISMYKIIGKHTFAYNPARINIGSIGYSGDLKDILVSSLYVCFKTIDTIDDYFLIYFFNSVLFHQAVESNVEGGIRSYLFYENFANIKIMLPSLPEQHKIASVFASIDRNIQMASAKLKKLEKFRKGLTQILFADN